MFIFGKIWDVAVDSIQTILLAASVFLVIYVFLFRPFQVNGLSMYPTFNNGEYVLTNLIPKTFHMSGPKLGDVIVFSAPPNPEEDYIKRVIGVPGDTVEVYNGNVYLNGKKLDQSSFLNSSVQTYGGAFLQEGQTITVPQGEFFVMGDNRPNSSDSRAWGFVPYKNIVGESLFVYWPPQHMRIVHNPFGK